MSRNVDTRKVKWFITSIRFTFLRTWDFLLSVCHFLSLSLSLCSLVLTVFFCCLITTISSLYLCSWFSCSLSLLLSSVDIFSVSILSSDNTDVCCGHFLIFAHRTCFTILTVWPDVGIKSCQKSIHSSLYSKIVQIVGTVNFILNWLFQKRPKRSQIFRQLLLENVLPRTFMNCPIWSRCSCLFFLQFFPLFLLSSFCQSVSSHIFLSLAISKD